MPYPSPLTIRRSYDLTLLEKVSLSDLQQKKRIIGPLDFNNRFNLALPPEKSILQNQFEDLVLYTSELSMIMNEKKAKFTPFIFSQTKDFQPQLSLEEGSFLDVVYQIKLVGLIVTSCLTWEQHIQYTLKKVNSVLAAYKV